MHTATTAETPTSTGSSQRREGAGPPADAGTSSTPTATTTPYTRAPITPSVTHSQMAERDSCQAGSWTGGAGGADITPILPGRAAARARPAGRMGPVMPQQVPTVSAADVPEDAVLLDVREDGEWVAGHAEGATHIPMGDVPARLDEVPEADPLYVVCRSGGRSARVAAWLNLNGYDAVNVAGGGLEERRVGKECRFRGW